MDVGGTERALERDERWIPISEALRNLDAKSNEPYAVRAVLEDYEDIGYEAAGEGKQRRKSVKWTAEEQQFVINGYAQFGPLWTEMLKEYPFHPHRIHTDLRDKWNNIERHTKNERCADFFERVNEGRRRVELRYTNPNANAAAAISPEMEKIRRSIRESAARIDDRPHPGPPPDDVPRYPLNLEF
jgi:hypothetical protein